MSLSCHLIGIAKETGRELADVTDKAEKTTVLFDATKVRGPTSSLALEFTSIPSHLCASLLMQHLCTGERDSIP